MKRKSIKEAYKGLSYSTASKKISDKYKDRDFNAVSQRSFLMEMSELMKLQEVAKAKEIALETLNQNSKPRQASKFELGGGLDPILELGQNLSPFPMMNFNNLGMPPTTNEVYNPNPSLQTDNTILTKDNTVKLGTNLTPIDFNTTNSKSVTAAGSNNKGNIYNPLIIGKAIEGIGKLGMLATGYDKVSPQYNPYEADIRRKMSSRGINMGAIRQRMLGQQNAGLDNTSNVRSEAVRQALSNSMFRGTQKNMADVSLQEQQINNQYLADEAQTLNNLGSQRVGANNYSENLNNQSKMGFELGLQNALESAGQVGTELTNKRAQLRQQGLLSEVLKTKNFELANAEDVLAKAAKGEEVTLNDMIKIVTSQGGSKTDAIELYMEYKKKYLGK